MKDSGKRIFSMDLVSKGGEMVPLTMERMSTQRKKVSANISSLMEQATKVIGLPTR